jgi:hypothetical protein
VELRDPNGLRSHAEGATGADRAGVDNQDLAVAIDVLLVVVSRQYQQRLLVAAGLQRLREPLGQPVLMDQHDVGWARQLLEPSEQPILYAGVVAVAIRMLAKREDPPGVAWVATAPLERIGVTGDE